MSTYYVKLLKFVTFYGGRVRFCENNGVEIADRGRGVSLQDILLLGVSGKRDTEGTVGQHGEGEVIGSLVAARLGYKKVMASQNWLAIAALDDIENRTILVLDVYTRKTPIVGTFWQYTGTNESWNDRVQLLETALDSLLNRFRRHASLTKKRIRVLSGGGYDTRGQLFSRGLFVSSMYNLACGYDLDATPGRDRAGFVWEAIEEEVQSLWQNHATAQCLADALKRAIDGYTTYEIDQLEGDFPAAMVQRATYLATGSKAKYRVVWVLSGECEAEIADASTKPSIKILKCGRRVPTWVRYNIPHVREAVSEQSLKSKEPRKPAKTLQKSIDFLLVAMGRASQTDFGTDNGLPHMYERCWFGVVQSLDDDNLACANAGLQRIVFSLKSIRKLPVHRFVGVVAHELAHIDTNGASDCTRRHSDAMEGILSRLAFNIANYPKLATAYRRGCKAFNAWKKTTKYPN